MVSRSLIKGEKIELNCSSITPKHKLHFSQKRRKWNRQKNAIHAHINLTRVSSCRCVSTEHILILILLSHQDSTQGNIVFFLPFTTTVKKVHIFSLLRLTTRLPQPKDIHRNQQRNNEASQHHRQTARRERELFSLSFHFTTDARARPASVLAGNSANVAGGGGGVRRKPAEGQTSRILAPAVAVPPNERPHNFHSRSAW